MCLLEYILKTTVSTRQSEGAQMGFWKILIPSKSGFRKIIFKSYLPLQPLQKYYVYNMYFVGLIGTRHF